MTDPNVDILARTLYGEARGEGKAGMEAAANVILNRAALASKHPHFGDGTIAGACKAPWQFSCWNHNDPNLFIIDKITDADPVFAQCLEIASDAANGLLEDNTNHATYYYARGSKEPPWAIDKEPCALIGRHIFFNNIA